NGGADAVSVVLHLLRHSAGVAHVLWSGTGTDSSVRGCGGGGNVASGVRRRSPRFALAGLAAQSRDDARGEQHAAVVSGRRRPPALWAMACRSSGPRFSHGPSIASPRSPVSHAHARTSPKWHTAGGEVPDSRRTPAR